MLENNETIVQCIGKLDIIINDHSVPKNIRRSADKLKKILSNEKESSSKRTAKVIYELDNIGNDHNIPIHTRTMVWGISSQLESIISK